MTEKVLWAIAAVVAAFVLFLQPIGKEEGPLFQKGTTYAAWQNDSYGTLESGRSISLLKKTNTEWVSLVVTWYQETQDSVVIYRDPRLTPDNQGVIRVIDQIHRLGMKVMLKPTVDVADGTWRGGIRFDSEEDWRAWFSSYRYFLDYYAELAAEQGVEEFCVGVELDETVHRDGDWRRIIEDVRTRYDGPLTYAANWDSYWDVPFWDALDYVGIDAYFTLPTESPPTVEALLSSWAPWIAELKMFHDIVRTPILFTELGVCSVEGASAQPWDWTLPGESDFQEQAHYYEAAFRAVWDKPWFYGFYWWTWQPESREISSTGYTPQGKPAERVLTQWYAKPVVKRP